jgi:hypothetical protein
VVKDDGAYSFASDFDEDPPALFVADHAGNEGTLSGIDPLGTARKLPVRKKKSDSY